MENEDRTIGAKEAPPMPRAPSKGGAGKAVSPIDIEKTLKSGDEPTPLPTSPSKTLGNIDQYELVRELGGGGFGTVFLARDTTSGTDVAVKGLPPLVRNNKEEVENIRKNFALVSTLDHTHITAPVALHLASSVRYADRSVAEKLRVFQGDILSVMKFAPGVTLSQWRRQFPDGKVPPETAIEIVRQIADALDYAHGEKIIHRDIKPANVMVETKDDGGVTARVLDFGLAAEVRSSMGRISKQVTDKSGTRPYMAPEQWCGRQQGPATDQYALAVLTYELLTGDVPFASVFETGDPVLMGDVISRKKPEIPSFLPRRQRAALMRALAKTQEKRFPSCIEFVDALCGKSRFHWRYVAEVAVVAALAVGGVFFMRPGDQAGSVTPPPPATPDPVVEHIPVVTPVPVVAEPSPSAEIIAERKAEEAVYELASDAETAHGLIDGENADFKSFFAVEIRAFETSRSAGNDARQNKKFVIATNLLTKALAQATALKAADGRRVRSNEALAAAAKAREAAVAVGAETEAKTAFEAAAADLARAEEALRAKNFEDAISLALSAKGRFAKIRLAIVEDALVHARRHQIFERWQECLEAANVILGWEPDNAAAKKLKDEAARNLAVQQEEHKQPAPKPPAPKPSVPVKPAPPKPAPRAHVPGEVRKVTLPGGAELELVWCPAGSFTMGSPASEEGHAANERQHRVKLTKGFWMGKYEVTQKQWESVMDTSPSRFASAKRPVENVSWEDCQAFCRKAGLGLRLPTEAEWEYACRAGTTAALSSGKELQSQGVHNSPALDDIAWYGGNSGVDFDLSNGWDSSKWTEKQYEHSRCGTHPVGAKGANAWGLHDMLGNVSEWCADWYGERLDDATDPQGPASGVERVYRGGNWFSSGDRCRSASRCGSGRPDEYKNDLGFRLCCSAEQAE